VSRTDAERLRDALDHLAVLERHASRGDVDDQLVLDAVSLRLAAAIEVLAGLDPGVRDRVTGGRWHLVWATRNRIAHGYALVDGAVIRATVDRDLPAFRSSVAAELARLTDGGGLPMPGNS